MKPITTSVIISTYNSPLWLEKVLWGYEIQTVNGFEVLIADDGSDHNTKSLIQSMTLKVSYPIQHVWQKDEGFQKTKILNKAIVASNSEYLIFTDGDCIPREDFVQTHLKLRRPNCVLSGGYFKLTESISRMITKDTIINQSCFDREWLLKMKQPKSFKLNKLTKSSGRAKFLNIFTPTKATFDGMNVSCYKKDVLEVNGFDERMKYGGEDRELGERMMNKGLKFLQVRYSAICVHLHHERPYKNEDEQALNKKIRQGTKRNKATYTPFGITK